MTDEAQPVTMQVDELEDTIEELRDELATATNRDIPLLKGTVRAIVGYDVDILDDLPPPVGRCIGGSMAEAVAAVERWIDALADIGAQKTTKEEKFPAVWTFAVNTRNGSDKVAVSSNEIKECVGVSRRYAYDLMEARLKQSTGFQFGSRLAFRRIPV